MSKSNATFQIYFRGAAVESGQMDVKELAPALLSIGSLIEETNRVLNGEKSTVSVKVVNFRDGSFGISLDVTQRVLTDLVNVFTNDHITAAANLTSLLGVGALVGGYSLFKLLRRLNKRIPDDVVTLEDGNIELVVKELKVTVPPEVFNLYKDTKVREEVENVVKPLSKDGIDFIDFKYDNEISETIKKDELSCFEISETESEKINEDVFTATYSIQSLSFKKGSKWKLSDGTNSIFVTILDNEYLEKIEGNLVSFSKGDRLKVKLRIKNYENTKGLKTDYEVLKILDHTKPPTQITFP